VLLVTGESSTYQLFSDVLSRYGYIWRCVTDAEIVTSEIAVSKPDIVFLDKELSGGNSLRVLESIRTVYPNLPVIFVANDPMDPFISSALRSGAVACLIKPIHKMDLVMILEENEIAHRIGEFEHTGTMPCEVAA